MAPSANRVEPVKMWTTPRTARRPVSIAVCVAAAVLVGLLSSSVPSGARVAVGEGIAGVRLGDSQQIVRRRLGRPRRIAPPAWDYGAPLRGQVGFGADGRVNDISTTSRTQRTTRGVSPGASPATFRRRYPEAKCYAHRSRRWSLLCVVDSKRGATVNETDFFFAGRLRRIDVFSVPSAGPIHPA